MGILLMRVAIVGSQAHAFSDYQKLVAKQFIKMTIHHYWVEYGKETVIVSGGADGVDTWAESEALDWGMDTRIYHPESSDWDGYRARNILVATECDVLYSVRSLNSKTFGSGWTANYAQKVGKEVFRYTV